MQHYHLLGIQPRWQAAGQYRSGLQSSCQYNAKGAPEGTIAVLHVAQQHSYRATPAMSLCVDRPAVLVSVFFCPAV